MMLMAPKGHFFGQMPHPMQRRSEMYAIFESVVTSMHSLPVRTTGHDFLHSCRHFCFRFAIRLHFKKVFSFQFPASSYLRLALFKDGSATFIHKERQKATGFLTDLIAVHNSNTIGIFRQILFVQDSTAFLFIPRQFVRHLRCSR